MGDAFGESFLYYSAVNPSTRGLERKVTFVKRVVVYGLPILVGSGYYHPRTDPRGDAVHEGKGGGADPKRWLFMREKGGVEGPKGSLSAIPDALSRS